MALGARNASLQWPPSTSDASVLDDALDSGGRKQIAGRSPHSSREECGRPGAVVARRMARENTCVGCVAAFTRVCQLFLTPL